MKGKKWFGILFVLCGLLLFPKAAFADVIWTPQDDFYDQHYEECEHIDRVFTANGPGGKVILYENPESSKEIMTMENGAKMYISFSYKDGKGVEWGVYENSDDNSTGWAPMAYLEVVYDNISFTEEFGDQFVEREGMLDSSLVQDEIYYWDYPGSENGFSAELMKNIEYTTVFEDEDGREWAFISYHFGIRSKWVCIDDPTADFETLYPEGGPERGENVSKGNVALDEIVPDTSKKDQLAKTAIISVSLVVLATAVLLVRLRKGRKNVD